MAQFYELESKSEIPGYFGDVFNPFGYYTFVVDPDRDYAEKGEHALVATTIFSAPLMMGAALSGGGASMPMWFGMGVPAFYHRAMAAAAWKKELVHGAFRGGFQALKGGIQRFPGVLAAGLAAGVGYYGSEVYGWLSGTEGIGDIRIRYR